MTDSIPIPAEIIADIEGLIDGTSSLATGVDLEMRARLRMNLWNLRLASKRGDRAAPRDFTMLLYDDFATAGTRALELLVAEGSPA